MIASTKQIACLCAAAALLTACAGESSRYPSLDIRPAERVRGTANPVAPIEQPAAPAVSEQTLAGITERASSAHARFLAAMPNAQSRAQAALDAAPGDADWAAAQVALADLDSARSQAAISLGELDILYTDARLANQALDGIDSARRDVLTMLGEEDRVLAELRATVR